MQTSLQDSNEVDKPYSLTKILLIWAASAIPMGILAYVLTPKVVKLTNWSPLIVYWFAVNLGLVWQFILSLIVLKIDGNKLNWQTVVTRMRYRRPVNPRTGKSSYWLLLWTIPFILLSAVIQMGVLNLPNVDALLTPLIKNLPLYDMSRDRKSVV